MSFVVHSDWLERMFDGTDALDFDGVGSDAFKMGIVTESTIDADTNALYSGLTAVGTATAWTGPVDLANEACGLDGSNDLLFDADDPSQIATDASGFSTARSLVIYDSVGGYIIAHHTEGSAFGNTTGPINISWPNGIWKLTI